MFLRNVIAASFSFLLVAPTIFMALDKQPPTIYSNIRLIPNEVYPGQEVTLQYTATNVRHFGNGLLDCQGKWQRRITDSTGATILTQPSPMVRSALMADNEVKTFEVKIVMPVLVEGPATFQILTSYSCNPIQRYISPIERREVPVHFTVKGGLPETIRKIERLEHRMDRSLLSSQPRPTLVPND